MLSARTLKWIHFAIMMVTLIMTPISGLTGLRNSVPYLVMISMLALVLSEFAGWQAARAEEASDDAEEIARKVLELLHREHALRN